jgi:hypothetical protein
MYTTGFNISTTWRHKDERIACLYVEVTCLSKEVTSLSKDVTCLSKDVT